MSLVKALQKSDMRTSSQHVWARFVPHFQHTRIDSPGFSTGVARTAAARAASAKIVVKARMVSERS
jgi:hypothetical protein